MITKERNIKATGLFLLSAPVSWLRSVVKNPPVLGSLKIAGSSMLALDCFLFMLFTWILYSVQPWMMGVLLHSVDRKSVV